MSELESIKRALHRERAARKEAERLLEVKSLELFESSQKIKKVNLDLERMVEERTKKIQSSEGKLRVIFEQNPDPILVTEANTYNIIRSNQKLTELFELVNSKELSENLILFLEESKEVVNESIPKNIFTTVVKKGGKELVLNVRASLISYEDKPAVIYLFEDITDRILTDIERRKSDQKYRDLVDNVSDIIYTCTGKGFFTFVNRNAIEMTGYSEEELLKMHFSELIREDYRSLMFTFYMNQINSRSKESYLEFPIVSKFGREIWLGQKVDFKLGENGLEFIALARNISKRKESEDLLKQSEEKYRNIIENMELGFLEVDDNDIIKNVYPKFCKMTGYSAEELIGQKAIDFLLPEEFRPIMYEQNNQRKEGEASVYEVQIIKKNGERIWVIISGAPLYDENNKLIGSVGIHLDITPRKKMEQELIEAKEIAEKSVRIKEEFMANMSHEIRTPMNAIVGMSELLEKTKLSSDQRKYINAITQSGSNLRVLINDILDFSKIESEKLELNQTENILEELLDEIKGTFEIASNTKDVDFQLNYPDNLPSLIFDRLRLNQVLINLSGNAVKFTSEGSVEINVDLVSERPTFIVLRIAVKDSGIGIPEEKLGTIFESFRQAENNTSHKYGGTGLGLAISQKLVGLMGGELKVKSILGKGSEFYFEVEFEKGNKIETHVKQTELPENYLEGKNILIVEDQQFNQMMICTILGQWGGKTVVAENGQIALNILKENQFDLIFMDIRMPIMGGLEATLKLKFDMGIKTPVVALTANVLESDQKKYKEAGMEAYLSKPFKQEELINLLIKINF